MPVFVAGVVLAVTGVVVAVITGVAMATGGVVVATTAGGAAESGAVTETEVVQVEVVPVGLVAVPVKSVSVFIALEVVVPVTAGETEPTPLFIEKVSAPGADQEKTV